MNVGGSQLCDVFWAFRPARWVSQALGLMPLKGQGPRLKFSAVKGLHTGTLLLFITVISFLVPYYMVKQDAAHHRRSDRSPNYPSSARNSSSHIDSSQSIAIIILNPIIISSMGIAAWVTALFRTPEMLPTLLLKLHQTDVLLAMPKHLHRRHFRTTCCVYAMFVCAGLAYLVYFSQKGAQAQLVFFTAGIVLADLCKGASFCTDLQFSILCYYVKHRFRLINSNLKTWQLINNGNYIPNMQSQGFSHFTTRVRRNVHAKDIPRFENGRDYVKLKNRQRLGILSKSDRLRNIFRNREVRPDKHHPFMIKVKQSDILRELLPTEKPSLSDALATLRRGHQYLCDVINDMNSLYGFHVLVSMSGCFANGLVNLYFALYGFTSSNGSVGNGVQNVWGRESDQTIGSLALTAYYVTRFLVLTCTAACTVNELEIFMSHVISCRPSFSACGFFHLDMSLITSALAAWSTYLVIMAQLHESK